MRRFTLVLPLLAAACTVGPDYRRPPIAGEAGNWIGPADSAPVDPAPWARLGDPLLVSLIDRAQAANPDIAEAEGRLREARAMRDAAAGHALPAIDATGSAQEQQLSKNGQLPIGKLPGIDRRFSLFDFGFDASWEIDLWGGTRRSVEAAGRQIESAAARAADTRLRIAAEVARTYADLRAAQAQTTGAKADADAQAGIARLTHQRFLAGEASRLDDARAATQARTTAATVPGLEAQARAAIYGLATLLGQPPEALLAELSAPAELPNAPADVALGIRSDMLRRRPDVRAAEGDLAAATANVGVETANLFPRFSLMGGIGQQARAPGDLVSTDSTRFQIGPSFRWPIFDAGRIRAQIRAADARADQAAARYTRAVLAALSDSETAVNRYYAALAALRENDAARDASSEALDLARQRYRAGEDDLLALLDAQSRYTAADRALIEARRQAITAYVALVKALAADAPVPDRPRGVATSSRPRCPQA